MTTKERASYLRSFKNKHKYTNRKLASLLGFSEQIISEWLNEKHPIRDDKMNYIFLLKNYIDTNKKEPLFIDRIRRS